MMPLFLFILILGWLISTHFHLRDALRFFQLHEYDSARFLRWSFTNWMTVWGPRVFAGSIFPAALIVSSFYKNIVLVIIALALWFGVALTSAWRSKRSRATEIKPLVYTARAKRLFLTSIALFVSESTLLFLAMFDQGGFLFLDGLSEHALLLYGCILGVLGQTAVFNIVLASLLIFPVEAAIRFYYVSSARKRIREIKPIVVGVTGSYGKTSVKDILSQILGYRYEVLKTPKSYNTLMGVCKVIREELRPKHQYFVVELGAYKKGEIERLCRLVKPDIGILTAVGPQHLERFKSIENIARAKNELIQTLPENGTAIFNGDDPICVKLSNESECKVRIYAASLAGPEYDLYAHDIVIGPEGTQFRMKYCEQEERLVKTVLLGRHNVSNILAASLAALECGVTVREVVRSIAHLEPTEHRLQLIKGLHNITYIDDAYNSNPLGASMAIGVLATFPGRKFLVTPGFVELGVLEDVENYRLGSHAARVCDFVILVGKANRLSSILEGLKAEKFDTEKIFVFDSLDQARGKLKEIVKPGDVILFENDLPDVY